MAAPAYVNSGTYGTGGNGTSYGVNVPSGSVNDIILVFIYKENADAITPAAGFTEDTNSPGATTGGTLVRFHALWKRADSGDSAGGTYTFSWTNSTYRAASAHRFSGAITSGNPWDVTGSSGTAASSTGAPAITLTTTGPDRLVIYGAGTFLTGAWTPPAGMNERLDTNDMTLDDLAQAAAGSTGGMQATQTNTAHAAWAGALLPVAVDAYALPPIPPPGRISPAGRWEPFVGDATAAATTPAAAGNAAGTGAANNAAVTVSPVAGNAAGTGTAGAAALTIAPTAGNAAGVGAAGAAALTIAPTAGNAAGTGAAGAPTPNVAPAAGNAAGTGAAGDTTITNASNAAAGNAAGTGAAGAAALSIAPGAGNAAGTGTASDAAASVATNTGAASGTGQALNTQNTPAPEPAPLFSPAPGRMSPGGNWSPFIGNVQASTDAGPTAGLASGTGAALDAAINVKPSAGNAAGTGTAAGAVPTVAPNAGNAAGTGAASAPTPSVKPNAGNAAGTGTAYQPTVSVPGSTNADAGNAAGTGQAFTASVSTSQSASAGHAAGTGTASGATITLITVISAGVATGTGTAFNTTNGVPAVDFPISAGTITDLTAHTHAGAPADAATRYHAGTPT